MPTHSRLAFGMLMANLLSLGSMSCKPMMQSSAAGTSEIASTTAPCPKKPAAINDQNHGAWLFTWTRSDLAVKDPNLYIEKAMTTSIEGNQRWLNPSFEFSPSESQGAGVYFAGDPLQSYGPYGRKLVVTRIKSFSAFPGGSCAKKGNPIVFSSEAREDFRATVASTIPGLFYQFGMTNFVSSMALVLRGNEAKQLIDAQKTRAFDLDQRAKDMGSNSLWLKEVPTVAANASFESLLEPFLDWIDLAMLAQTNDSTQWITEGKVSAAGMVAAITADIQHNAASAEKRLKELQTGAHAEQLKNSACGMDLGQCLDFAHQVLSGQIPDPRMPLPIFTEILATLGYVGTERNAFGAVSEIRAAVVQTHGSQVNADKLRAALNLFEAFRQKLQPDSMSTWKTPEDAF